MSRYIRKDAECAYCGEICSQSKSDHSRIEFKRHWKDGLVECGHCAQTCFEDYCASVGANPITGILNIP